MECLNKNPNRKYEYLNQLSTERLEELLTLNTNPFSDQEDDEYIDAILEVILKRENENPTGRPYINNSIKREAIPAKKG